MMFVFGGHKIKIDAGKKIVNHKVMSIFGGQGHLV